MKIALAVGIGLKFSGLFKNVLTNLEQSAK